MYSAVHMVMSLLLLAQTGPLPLSQRLDQLNSSDFATRRTATQALMRDRDLTDEQLDQLYSQASSPEQKHRLEQIALHQCLRQWIEKYKPGKGPDVGSIGISLHAIKPQTHPTWDRAGIVVDATMPGFPANEYLQSGDLIVALNGLELGANPPSMDLRQVFITLIKQQAPGQVIDLKIIRRGNAINIQFPTAPAACLEQLYKDRPVLEQRIIQLSPLGVKLWQKRLLSLCGQATISPASYPEKPDNQIPIQWQVNAGQ